MSDDRDESEGRAFTRGCLVALAIMVIVFGWAAVFVAVMR
jgi:hypothetical protein